MKSRLIRIKVSHLTLMWVGFLGIRLLGGKITPHLSLKLIRIMLKT